MKTGRVFASTICFAAVVLDSASATATSVNLTIPAARPRLWFGNEARLQQARSFFPNPIPAGASDFYTRALNGVVNRNTTDCQAAANYFNGYVIGQDGFRDNIRQNGEDLLLMFDWCHDQFTPSQIHTLVDRWNGYLDQEFNDQSLGNDGDEANNY